MNANSMIHILVLFFVVAFPSVSVACGGSRPLALCCRTIGPYSGNANIWSSLCGLDPENQNILIGGACESNVVPSDQWYICLRSLAFDLTDRIDFSPEELCCASSVSREFHLHIFWNLNESLTLNGRMLPRCRLR
jgi:hypothetical protein